MLSGRARGRGVVALGLGGRGGRSGRFEFMADDFLGRLIGVAAVVERGRLALAADAGERRLPVASASWPTSAGGAGAPCAPVPSAPWVVFGGAVGQWRSRICGSSAPMC